MPDAAEDSDEDEEDEDEDMDDDQSFASVDDLDGTPTHTFPTSRSMLSVWF